MPQNHNTLTGLFSDIADAIRAKTGGSSQIVADDFPTAIANILSGPARTSADLSVSGATVTAPAGVYSTDASASVASGSATTPATTISSSPTITVSSAGLITATNSKTQSITPTVSAGYVSSGAAGTITVSGSNTSQLTTQAAQTIYPSASDQTITSGKYLTGTQTIKGVVLTNLTAGNIKKDVVVKVGDSADDDRITSVTGTYEGSGGGGGGITPSSVIPTDLTGTIWYMNETITITSVFPVSVLFQSLEPETDFGYRDDTIVGDAGVPACRICSSIMRFGTTQLRTNEVLYDMNAKEWQAGNIYIFYTSSAKWKNYGGRIWRFISDPTSGFSTDDHTNSAFISWMLANGQLLFPLS